ncbi:MAG: SAM-dependent methyltransferase [Paraglaciecola sp.]|jgi:SAM-dependent methyltransferase
MKCRHCTHTLQHVFLDLGFAPPSNAYLSFEQLKKPELYFPLKLFVCEKCWLVQTEDFAQADELFSSTYAYFSSISKGWLAHAAAYSAMITEKLALDENSLVIEVAANDGYLLKNFVASGIPCIGIEPTLSTAIAAEALNIPIIKEFFGYDFAQTLVADNKQADLIVGNNVFAHVPDINDFTQGLRAALKPSGTITLEFPHLLQLLNKNQFDTVYHEHFSYLSLYSVKQIFSLAGLKVFDVEELVTHGGSLRVYACHENDTRTTSTAVDEILKAESANGMRELKVYQEFQERADNVKNSMLNFLIEQHDKGAKVAAYGAAAKGCTLLNYAGVKPDLLSYVCDAAPSKQGGFLPGSHIPIFPPNVIAEQKPNYVIILPWNIQTEVMEQLSYIRDWGGKFVVAVPELRVM